MEASVVPRNWKAETPGVGPEDGKKRSLRDEAVRQAWCGVTAGVDNPVQANRWILSWGRGFAEQEQDYRQRGGQHDLPSGYLISRTSFSLVLTA